MPRHVAVTVPFGRDWPLAADWAVDTIGKVSFSELMSNGDTVDPTVRADDDMHGSIVPCVVSIVGVRRSTCKALGRGQSVEKRVLCNGHVVIPLHPPTGAQWHWLELLLSREVAADELVCAFA